MLNPFFSQLLPSLFQAGGQAGLGGLQGLAQGPLAAAEYNKAQDEAKLRALRLLTERYQAFPPGRVYRFDEQGRPQEQFTVPGPELTRYQKAELAQREKFEETRKGEFQEELGRKLLTEGQKDYQARQRLDFQRESLAETRRFHTGVLKERELARKDAKAKGKSEELQLLLAQRDTIKKELDSLQKGSSWLEQAMAAQVPGGAEAMARERQEHAGRIAELQHELGSIEIRLKQLQTAAGMGQPPPLIAPPAVTPPPAPVQGTRGSTRPMAPHESRLKSTPLYKETYEKWKAFFKDAPNAARIGAQRAFADATVPATERAAINDAMTEAGF